jgi:AMP nucleosidase
MASQFYRERVDQHLRIGVSAGALLRRERLNRLQCRRPRSVTEAACR